ncbi:hypothetical protein HHS_02890 [Candidatus Pantoea carbekii]|uniref:Uncharacterized protein n=1 Tax=Candidatus Pantoea carbekii TaxID=1235990 RepID=U3U7L2_9GAMM|nr:hypothetical protein HHS_02890 [Candidatus Pantoea carbekii]
MINILQRIYICFLSFLLLVIPLVTKGSTINIQIQGVSEDLQKKLKNAYLMFLLKK